MARPSSRVLLSVLPGLPKMCLLIVRFLILFSLTRSLIAVWSSPSTAILVSVAHKLTAALTEGDKAQIFPLNPSKTSPDLPSLRQAQEARAIHLKEVFVKDGPSRPTVSGAPTSEKGKRRDWLPLLIREALGMSYERGHML